MSDATGALPRYQQISELLIREVASGRLPDGTRLPPEREMAADLGVAVGTLRKALADLQAKGMLERVQGSGNYIRARANIESIYAMFRLELLSGGGLPAAQVLSVERHPKPADLPAFGNGQDAHRIRRLRSLSGQIAALEEIWLCASFAPELSATDLSQSLYLHYRRHLNLWILRAEDRIGQAPLPDWTPATFGHASGALMPHVTRVSWSQDNARAEVSQTWFDPAIARYVARIT